VCFAKTILRAQKNMRKWVRGQLKYYTSSFEILKYGNAHIELIEEDEYGDKQQMLERERYWVETLDSVNQLRPMVTREESIDTHRANVRRNNGKKVPCSYCGKIMRRDVVRKHIKRKHNPEVANLPA